MGYTTKPPLRAKLPQPMMVDRGVAPPFRTPRWFRPQIETNIGYEMVYGARNVNSPNLPMDVMRSRFQPVLRFRSQWSLYFSKLRNFGMRRDYPVARVLSIVNTAEDPRRRPVPTINRFGKVSAKGIMGSPPRFSKALPYPTFTLTPPEYGTTE